MKAPTNMRKLIAFLTKYPLVDVQHPQRSDGGPAEFNMLDKGKLWFRRVPSGDEIFVPLIDPDAPKVPMEAGIQFQANGFVIDAYDSKMTFRYRKEVLS